MKITIIGKKSSVNEQNIEVINLWTIFTMVSKGKIPVLKEKRINLGEGSICGKDHSSVIVYSEIP